MVLASSQVKVLSLLPFLQCPDSNPYISGGLVVKQVNISPTGVRHSTSLQGILYLSLITHFTINRQTLNIQPYGVMLCSPQTSKHYPHRAMEQINRG